MKRRPVSAVPAGLLAVSAVLLLVSCVPDKVTLPQSPALKWLERRSGRIAYVALDGNIRTTDQAGGGQKDVTTDAAVDENEANPSFFYLFPVWSRDARSLAFTSIRRTASTVQESGIWTSALNGAAPTRVYTSDERVARMLSWAPDSSRLVFVTGSGPGENRLETVSAQGGDARVLRSGAGFSWRWESRGSRIALHSVSTDTDGPSEQVAILDPRGTADEKDFSQSPGSFDAPMWSADGSVIMAVGDSSGPSMGSTLTAEDASGHPGRPLAHVDGSAILDLSPDGTRLAWVAPPTPGDTASRSLFVLDLASRQGETASPGETGAPDAARQLSGGDDVAAFFWSPDGSRIAYFVPSGADDIIALKVLTVKTGAVRTVASFTASRYFLSVLQEFGQYSESMRLWSPDSRFLLYCAVQPDSFDIMVAYADQPIAPRKVADGLVASWSPK